MTQTLSQLSNRAVYALTQQESSEQPIFVQVVDFQLKKEKYYIMISDGSFMIKALPKDQQTLNPETDLNAIICIRRRLVKNNVVGIMDFQKVFNYKAKIGDPQEYNAESINPENVQTFKLQKSLIELNHATSQRQQTIPKQPQTPQQPTTVKKQEISNPVEPQKRFVPKTLSQPLNGNLKDYETIRDLWIGLNRWTIVCRIVKMEYSEFISKKTAKETRVLNVELMDRTGMKISGAFFGESALKFKDELVKDRVYKISQGQLREESYNNSKNQKISPYKLVFTNISTFEQVSDTNSIAKNEDSAITLGECVEKRIIGQEYDIVCILINVQESIGVKKDNKQLKKTNLLVADPVKQITLHAVVWNSNLVPSSELFGKTIILSRFKLNEYKNSLGLASIFKSSIIPVESHPYQQFEKQTMQEYSSYEKLYEIKSSGLEGDYEVCTTIKELEDKVERMGNDEWARSELTIFINRFALKKWHYDGCPHCSKAAQPLNNCTHCGVYAEKTVGHFIMGVQVCDATGSMWTIAYDEWAKKIFGVTDQTEVIDYFLKLDGNQLRQETESYLYQEYRLRISSKKDNEGRIKHNVSKIHQRNFADQTIKNIELISKMSIS